MNSFAGRSLHLCALLDREKTGMPVKNVKKNGNQENFDSHFFPLSVY
jgi:hypothetical protein